MVKFGSGFWTPEHAFEEVISHMGEEASFEEANEKLMELLCHGYDKSSSPSSSSSRDNVVSKCCWHSIDFFRNHREVNYTDLITYWIMEGYFDPIEHLEEAYEKGHRVLMLFIDSGFLKKQEDNVMAMEGANLQNLTDGRRLGFDGEASLGLTNVQQTGLGRVIQTQGMIRTYLGPKKLGRSRVSSILVDGSRLCREVMSTTEVTNAFFQNMQDLKILALFNPRFESIPVSVVETDKLLTFAFRDCVLLGKVYHLQKLKSLVVLEISGARHLKRIPDEMFDNMLGLKSLNLSSAQFTSLPPSFSKLTELRWLVLRGCSRLASLESLGKFVKLEVLVLSGCTSFKRFTDRIFPNLEKLRILDLSYTSIQRLPFLHKLGRLKRLLLRGCESLHVIPRIECLSSLQVLDVHGATKVSQLQDESFESLKNLVFLDFTKILVSQLPSNIGNISELYLSSCSHLSKLPSSERMQKLKILDLSDVSMLSVIEDSFFDHLTSLGYLLLSRAKVKTLPSLSKLKNLHHLLTRDCKELKELPSVRALEKLEVVDVSGCSELKLVQDESFENIPRLQTLDLSGTQVERLPSLPNPSNLRRLLLVNCTKLTELPQMESQSKLEELNLSGASSLKEIKVDFLKDMGHLQILNLSQTPLDHLPSMAGLKELRELVLSQCSGLKEVPDLEALTKLEVLDLSGTGVSSLPSLSTFTNLRELLLTNCKSLEFSSLESVSGLEVLCLWGTRTKEFPYKITESTHLKHLDLPDFQAMGQVDWNRVKCLPEKLNWEQCGLIKPAETDAESSKLPVFSTKTPLLEETYFKQFNIYFHGDEQGMDDIYFLVRHIPRPQKQGEFVEIRSSYSIPDSFNIILRQAETVSLVDHVDISPLSKLGASTVESMKRCCLEGCSQMESILSGENSDAELGQKIETLWVSNLPKLKSMCSEKLKGNVGFGNLQHLYLDCCPLLQYVFSESQLPPNLETLQVKFCVKLETIIKHNNEKDLSTLSKLKTLYLLELPELKRIGFTLPKTCEIKECPKLGQK